MESLKNLTDRLNNLTLEEMFRLADAIFKNTSGFENRVSTAVKEIKQFIEENPDAKDYQQFILDVIDGKHPEPLFNKVNIQFEPLTPDNVPSDMKALVESFGKDITSSHDLFQHLEYHWDELPDDLREMCFKADSALSEEIELHNSPLVWQGDKLDASNQRALLSTMYRASLYERLNIKEAQNVVLKENSVSEEVSEKPVPKVNISSYANNPTVTFMVLTSKYGGLRANDILASGLDVTDIDAFKSKDLSSQVKLVQTVLRKDSVESETIKDFANDQRFDVINRKESKENMISFQEKLDKVLSDIKGIIENCSQEEFDIYKTVIESESQRRFNAGYKTGFELGASAGMEETFCNISKNFSVDPGNTIDELCKNIKSSIQKSDSISERFAIHSNNSKKVAELQKSVDTLRKQQDSFIGKLRSSLFKMLPASLYNTLSSLDRQINSFYPSTSLHPLVARNFSRVVDGLPFDQRKETAEGIVEMERLLLGDNPNEQERLDNLSSLFVEISLEGKNEEVQQQTQSRGFQR